MPEKSTNSILPNTKIAIIGLGYVGLPLAAEFAKKYKVTGFDTGKRRVNEVNKGHDRILTITDEELAKVIQGGDTSGLICSEKLEDIADCNIYIVTVPTPVDKFNRPDLSHLHKASETVGKVLKKSVMW